MTTPSSPAYREIPLSQGQVAIVDADNFERINQHKWYALWNPAKRGFYAVRHKTIEKWKNRLIYMHREILGLDYGNPLEGDHKDTKATLDNRIANLRIVNDRQQQCNKGRYASNKAGFKGVSFCPERNNYLACISVNGKTKNLGRRPTAEAAAALYWEAAQRLHGQYARNE